ncbi:MAG: hypothetical protein WBQ50_14380, partial [Nocardioides sp.]
MSSDLTDHPGPDEPGPEEPGPEEPGPDLPGEQPVDEEIAHDDSGLDLARSIARGLAGTGGPG